MKTRHTLPFLITLLSLVAAACSAQAEPPGTDPPQTSQPPDTTQPPDSTLPPADGSPCDDPGRAWSTEFDLDGDGTDELIVLVQTDDLKDPVLHVCIDESTRFATDLDGEQAQVIGFHDLDGDAVRELLYTTAGERGRVLSVATLTLRGLQTTDVRIEQWNDLVDAGGGPFSGETFQCIDWDEDGSPDLIHWQFQPADNDEVNVLASIVTLVEGTAVETGVDLFETTPGDAAAILDRLHGCGPGDVVLPDVRFNATGWARVPANPTVFAGTNDVVPTAVAATDRIAVAVGVHAPNPIVGGMTEPEPRAWFTEDGIAWTAAEVDGTNGEMLGVTATADGFVAVGRIGDNGAVWRSSDGRAWEMTEITSLEEDGLTVLYSVIDTPLGLVAVGMEMYFPDFDAAVWTSPDGTDWTRVTSPAFGTVGFQPNDNGEFNAEIYDIAVTVDGLLVGIGYDSESNPDIDFPDQFPAAWVSSDGQTWERTRLSQEARLTGIAAVDNELVAFGTSNLHGSPTSDAVIVRSSDGRTWTNATGEFSAVTAVDGIQSINAVAQALGGGWIAVGSDQAEFDSRGAGAVWQTFDLADWDRLEHDATVWGEIDVEPVVVMNDAVTLPTGDTLVVGYAGETEPLPGGGSACCLKRPQLWLFSPDRAGS